MATLVASKLAQGVVQAVASVEASAPTVLNARARAVAAARRVEPREAAKGGAVGRCEQGVRRATVGVPKAEGEPRSCRLVAAQRVEGGMGAAHQDIPRLKRGRKTGARWRRGSARREGCGRGRLAT